MKPTSYTIQKAPVRTLRKAMLLTLALLAFAGVFAQTSNVILFTENGERFYAVLNGLKMNEEPVTNLKVEELNQPGYKLKVIFEDKNLPDMDKNLYLQPGEETVYMVRQNKKGDYKLAFRSSVPVAQAPAPAPDCYIYAWGTGPRSTGSAVVVEETTTTTTTTTTDDGLGTTTTTGTGESVNMNVNVDGFGMNVNVNTTETGTVGTTTGTTTVTSTTTTTTTGGGYVEEDVVYVEEAPCSMMGAGDYESACSSIRSKSFSDSKMTLAKQITENNCLSAAQVKGIMELFDFEDDRLEYAKFAWHYCTDRNNYYKVNDAFDFESTIEELDAYINAQR